ncbi:tyrosine-type recombinase/integrase [Jannaschia sp. CCS1]|uniref:tyrosine-type recombinase/integrase n=1 Tax=Jannaschia sp. (strain CCS1) TaxID=290400 RepID=UPI000053D7D0|nr:site-specific integrase [Jannaschia sp. CCS1]ABD53146.1 phage integrase [Jannaschia sp. CCS1]
MAHVLNRLKATQISALPKGKYADGAGLWLYKSTDESGQWVFRYTLYTRRHEMGLGSASTVALKAARARAAGLREQVQQGVDPIKARRDAEQAALRNMNTLHDVTLDAFESRKADLRDDGKAGRWLSPLELHVLPKLGRMPISEIDQRDIRDTLAPIWHAKADTARKAMGRLGIVFKHAAALGLDVDLQATEKAKALLGRSRHVSEHIPSMDWREVPAFFAKLSDGSTTHLALRLLILTGLRSKPIRFAHVDEIDGNVWTVPGEKMKARKHQSEDFRVPLSSLALEVIEAAKPMARDGYLFPGVRKGVISDATMSSLMTRMELTARPHGFRSSFREWAAKAGGVEFDTAEMSISHKVRNSTQKAYLRDDQLEQRSVLMERWADHVSGGTGQVVSLAIEGRRS